jgi:hypothetical protein
MVFQTVILRSNQNFCVNSPKPILCVKYLLVITRSVPSISKLLAKIQLRFEREAVTGKGNFREGIGLLGQGVTKR